jgi:hypothetical protein
MLVARFTDRVGAGHCKGSSRAQVEDCRLLLGFGSVVSSRLQHTPADLGDETGYLITETDPYYFEADQNPNDTEMEAVHLRMLANYCSWIRIAATSYFVNEDRVSKNDCVM